MSNNYKELDRVLSISPTTKNARREWDFQHQILVVDTFAKLLNAGIEPADLRIFLEESGAAARALELIELRIEYYNVESEKKLERDALELSDEKRKALKEVCSVFREAKEATWDKEADDFLLESHSEKRK